jgi:20S proteasome alpha/beta subunit
MEREFASETEILRKPELRLDHQPLRSRLNGEEKFVIKSVVALQSADGIVIALTKNFDEETESKDKSHKECRTYKLGQKALLITFCNSRLNEKILDFIANGYFEMSCSSRSLPVARMFKDLKDHLTGNLRKLVDAQVVLATWSMRKGPRLFSINTKAKSTSCLGCAIGDSSEEIQKLLSRIDPKSSNSRKLLPEAGKVLMLAHEKEEQKAGKTLAAVMRFGLIGQTTNGKLEQVKGKLFDEVFQESEMFFQLEKLPERDDNDNKLEIYLK